MASTCLESPSVGQELWGVVYRLEENRYAPSRIGRIDRVDAGDRRFRAAGRWFSFSCCWLFTSKADCEAWCAAKVPQVPTVSGLVSR